MLLSNTPKSWNFLGLAKYEEGVWNYCHWPLVKRSWTVIYEKRPQKYGYNGKAL